MAPYELIPRVPSRVVTPEVGLDLDDDLRTAITLSRTHPQDVQQRHVIVRLDEGRKLALSFGDSYTVEIDPGRHCLRAHNTLFRKRLEFSIEPGEHLEFLFINSARWWTASMAAILGAAPLFLQIVRRSVR